MSVLDLIKATGACGGLAYLFYSYPVLSQILAIAILSVMWFFYACETILALRRKHSA